MPHLVTVVARCPMPLSLAALELHTVEVLRLFAWAAICWLIVSAPLAYLRLLCSVRAGLPSHVIPAHRGFLLDHLSWDWRSGAETPVLTSLLHHSLLTCACAAEAREVSNHNPQLPWPVRRARASGCHVQGSLVLQKVCAFSARGLGDPGNKDPCYLPFPRLPFASAAMCVHTAGPKPRILGSAWHSCVCVCVSCSHAHLWSTRFWVRPFVPMCRATGTIPTGHSRGSTKMPACHFP